MLKKGGLSRAVAGTYGLRIVMLERNEASQGGAQVREYGNLHWIFYGTPG